MLEPNAYSKTNKRHGAYVRFRKVDARQRSFHHEHAALAAFTAETKVNQSTSVNHYDYYNQLCDNHSG